MRNEGIARDLVNRIQNIRKETQLEVTDFINVFFCANNEIKNAILDARKFNDDGYSVLIDIKTQPELKMSNYSELL